MNSFRAVLITTVTAFSIACSAVAAAGTLEVPTLAVKYDDAEVRSERGAELLYARLRSASQKVCSAYESDTRNMRNMHRRAIWKSCVDQALANAVAEVNAERITALHQRTSVSRAS